MVHSDACVAPTLIQGQLNIQFYLVHSSQCGVHGRLSPVSWWAGDSSSYRRSVIALAGRARVINFVRCIYSM